ncbi:MAG: DUF3712 domain-containing protein, partial [Thermoplasmata archaeon]
MTEETGPVEDSSHEGEASNHGGGGSKIDSNKGDRKSRGTFKKAILKKRVIIPVAIIIGLLIFYLIVHLYAQHTVDTMDIVVDEVTITGATEDSLFCIVNTTYDNPSFFTASTFPSKLYVSSGGKVFGWTSIDALTIPSGVSRFTFESELHITDKEHARQVISAMVNEENTTWHFYSSVKTSFPKSPVPLVFSTMDRDVSVRSYGGLKSEVLSIRIIDFTNTSYSMEVTSLVYNPSIFNVHMYNITLELYYNRTMIG